MLKPVSNYRRLDRNLEFSVIGPSLLPKLQSKVDFYYHTSKACAITIAQRNTVASSIRPRSRVLSHDGWHGCMQCTLLSRSLRFLLELHSSVSRKPISLPIPWYNRSLLHHRHRNDIWKEYMSSQISFRTLRWWHATPSHILRSPQDQSPELQTLSVQRQDFFVFPTGNFQCLRADANYGQTGSIRATNR